MADAGLRAPGLEVVWSMTEGDLLRLGIILVGIVIWLVAWWALTERRPNDHSDF